MPRRRRIVRIIAASALALIVVASLVAFIAWRRWNTAPSYWHVTPQQGGAAAVEAERFENWVASEVSAVRDSPDHKWAIQVDADQINQWLAEQLPAWAANQGVQLPPWLAHPMVAMQRDRFIIAAEVHRDDFTQIVSLVYRPTTATAGRPAQLDLVEIRGGSLGISGDWAIDALLNQAKPDQREKLRTQLQHIVLQLPLKDRRTITVEQMKIEDGRMTLHCRTQRTGQ